MYTLYFYIFELIQYIDANIQERKHKLSVPFQTYFV